MTNESMSNTIKVGCWKPSQLDDAYRRDYLTTDLGLRLSMFPFARQ